MKYICMLFKTDPTFRRKAAGEARTTVLSFSSSIYILMQYYNETLRNSVDGVFILLFWYFIKIHEKK